jgi:hypothetical protein
VSLVVLAAKVYAALYLLGVVLAVAVLVVCAYVLVRYGR